MPQDIPLEASETLVFTPDSLKHMGGDAPAFSLRAPTNREKRFIRRLYVRNGLQRHSQADIRGEILTGLKALWSEDAYEANSAMLTAYWAAEDEFTLQAQDDPDIVFNYDPDVREACSTMPQKVARFWPKLGDMLADNRDFDELTDAIHVAVIVKDWSNLDTARKVEDGYVTLDCAEAILAALDAVAVANPNKDATLQPSAELILACWRRFRLDEEEAKNSASPSPSETSPEPSKPKANGSNGKSPASARSKKTLQSA